MSHEPKPEYEAPTVEEVETEDSPAVTAAGDDSPVDFPTSDLRLKHSVRALERPTPGYEAPTVEEVETDDAPAVTAAGDSSPVDDVPSDLRLKQAVRPLAGAIVH